MPELTADDRLVLAHVAGWYRTGRGALTARHVAEATGLSRARVVASAQVLSAAGRVRTYRPHGADGEVLFVGLVTARPEVVDLTAHATWGPVRT